MNSEKNDSLDSFNQNGIFKTHYNFLLKNNDDTKTSSVVQFRGAGFLTLLAEIKDSEGFQGDDGLMASHDCQNTKAMQRGTEKADVSSRDSILSGLQQEGKVMVTKWRTIQMLKLYEEEVEKFA